MPRKMMFIYNILMNGAVKYITGMPCHRQTGMSQSGFEICGTRPDNLVKGVRI
jgi:hypothetical protein